MQRGHALWGRYATALLNDGKMGTPRSGPKHDQVRAAREGRMIRELGESHEQRLLPYHNCDY